MISRRPDGIRLTFLGRFLLATFVLYIAVSATLASILIKQHETAVESDEGTNAAGQIAALATLPLPAIPDDANLPAIVRERLRKLDDAGKRLEYVDGIRIYRADGTAVYPPAAPAAPDDVAKTLASGNLWLRDVTASRDGDVRTEYLPFFAPHREFVIAIDLSVAAMRLQAGDEARGVIVSTGIAIGLVLISLIALAAGASHEIERRRRESEQGFVTILGVLAETIDKRDPYTAGHSKRVAAYSRILARELKFTRREQDVIEQAALLHDVGKIGIPDAVLLKPGKLDADEREVISTHPRIGADILRGSPAMEDIVPCVLHHHERIDGSGYPDGLVANDIPRGARVIAVADTFDAMTTDRPYRKALSIACALVELRRVASTQLEPAFVETFIRLVETGRLGPLLPSPLVRDTNLAAVG
jgi:putative nucleotidyltransferase with HDIG domain